MSAPKRTCSRNRGRANLLDPAFAPEAGASREDAKSKRDATQGSGQIFIEARVDCLEQCRAFSLVAAGIVAGSLPQAAIRARAAAVFSGTPNFPKFFRWKTISI